MFIQTESTPNPATLKFLPGRSVLDAGTADFPNAEASEKSPLAARIFAVDGVSGVFFGTDFVTLRAAPIPVPPALALLALPLWMLLRRRTGSGHRSA